MSGLHVLRQILEAQSLGQEGTSPALPIGELRFVLEYRTPPDLDAERGVIADIVGASRFELRPLAPEGELARHVVLRFPGVERTLSRATLFDIAYELTSVHRHARVEPDVSSSVFVDPEPTGVARRPESVGDVLGPLCWVDAPPPADHLWALRSIGAIDAWELVEGRGADILIGQPDTGVAAHLELDPDALRLDLAANILDGSRDPTDPLSEDVANPGHGIGTASVAISRDGGSMIGAAPGAQLVPIRCIEDVKVIDGLPVATAVRHAVDAGCHIVSMSLGGLPSAALHAAVRDAVAKDLIVLAAAGNCVGVVVYPARYDEVIAVAGVNSDGDAWRGTSKGGSVDVSAPAELVWRAERRRPSDPLDGVSAGQGTSFAVALTAGVAALWLDRHGRTEVVAEARRRGTTVQELFRIVLRTTARRPAGWDQALGAGIVDAAALVSLPLARIPPGADSARRLPSDDVAALLAEVAGPGQLDPGFDWGRYGLEVSDLLLADARFGRRGSAGNSVESHAPGRTPSRELARDGVHSDDHRLRDLVRRTAGGLGGRHATSDAARQVVILGSARRGKIEAASTLTMGGARRALEGGGIDRLMNVAATRLDHLVRADGSADPVVRELRARILTQGPDVLSRIAKEPARRLTSTDRAALEALVALTGRPALRIQNGKLDPNDAMLGDWQGGVVIGQPDIERGFASVGRINMDGDHVGTGFLVGPDLVMTNRHVVEVFAAPVPRKRNPSRWVLEGPRVTIDFTDRGSGGPDEFDVLDVVSAGADPIGESVSFSHLDMALLRVSSRNTNGRTLPEPVRLMGRKELLARGGQIFVVGYPAKPTVLPMDTTGQVRMDVVERLRAIFGLKYGMKYFSPGLVSHATGTPKGDAKSWIFHHDATTLGGNSGSPIFWLGDPIAVVGLHFAGDWLRANDAHDLTAVRASDMLPALSLLPWV